MQAGNHPWLSGLNRKYNTKIYKCWIVQSVVLISFSCLSKDIHGMDISDFCPIPSCSVRFVMSCPLTVCHRARIPNQNVKQLSHFAVEALNCAEFSVAFKNQFQVCPKKDSYPKTCCFYSCKPITYGRIPSTSTVWNWKLLAPKDVVVEIECRSDSTTWRKHPSVQSSCHLAPLHDSWWSFLHRIMERLNIQEALMLHTFGHYYVHVGFHWHISLSLSYLLICFHIYIIPR